MNLRKLPGVIQLPKGKKLYPIVLRTVDRHEDGSPKTLTIHRPNDGQDIILDEDKVNNEFWIVYGTEGLLKRPD